MLVDIAPVKPVTDDATSQETIRDQLFHIRTLFIDPFLRSLLDNYFVQTVPILLSYNY